jgi:hypothetical protein
MRLFVSAQTRRHPQIDDRVFTDRRVGTSIETVFIDEVFAANGGLATREQLLAVMPRNMLARHVEAGAIVRVWHGIYVLGPPDTFGLLAGPDLMTDRSMVACMNTAAELYGFNTEDTARVRILDPGVRMRPAAGLMVP